eukprot:1594461-Alexandrium_andersonii.AAC.1
MTLRLCLSLEPGSRKGITLQERPARGESNSRGRRVPRALRPLATTTHVPTVGGGHHGTDRAHVSVVAALLPPP